MLSKLSNFIVNKRFLITGLLAACVVVCAVLMTMVEVNYDASKYLADSSEMKQGVDIMEDEFPDATEYQTIRVMFEGLSAEQQDEILDELEGIEYVDSVDFNADSESYVKDGYTKYVINTEYAYRSAEETSIEDTVKEMYADLGVVLQNDSTAQYSLPIWLIALALGMLFAILFLMCSSWFEPLLFLMTIIVAVVLNMGTNIFLGSVSDITMSIAAILQIVLSMDYSIILMNRYRQEKAAGLSPQETMKAALTNSFGSICSSSLTTIVGLLALCFMSFKIGMNLGIVLAKGVFFSLFCIFTLLPCLIILFDKVIEKTSKKELNIPMKPVGIFSYKMRWVMIPLFVLLFIGASQLKNNTEMAFVLEDEDPIADIFPTTNQLVAVYETKDEESAAALADSIEEDEHVSQVMGYSSTFTKGLTADDMLEMVEENMTGDTDFSLDSSMISALYYDYFGEDVTDMTMSEFITFLCDDIAENETFADYIDEDMRENLDMFRKFADAGTLTKKMSASELASLFEYEDSSDIEKLYLLYQIENDTDSSVKLTISELVSYILDEVANNPDYADMLDADMIADLKEMQKYTVASDMTKSRSVSSMASLLGMDEDEALLLYTYYFSKNGDYTPGKMTTAELASFMNEISGDSTFSSYFDSDTKAQLSQLTKFTDKEYITKKRSAKKIAEILGMDVSQARAIFMADKYGTGDTGEIMAAYLKSLSEEELSAVLSSMISASDARQMMLSYINSLSTEELRQMAISNINLGELRLAATNTINGMSANDLRSQALQSVSSMSDDDLKSMVKTSIASMSENELKYMVTQSLSSKSVQELQGLLISMGGDQTYVLTLTTTDQLIAAITSQGADTLRSTMNSFVDTMSTAQLQAMAQQYIAGLGEDELRAMAMSNIPSDSMLIALATQKINTMTDEALREQTLASINSMTDDEILAYIASFVSSTDQETLASLLKSYISELSSEELTALSSKFSVKTGKKMSLKKFVNTILKYDSLTSQMDSETLGQLKMLQKIMQATADGESLGYSDAADIFGMDKSTAKMLYTYHDFKDGTDKSLSAQTLVNFIVDNSDDFSGMMSASDLSNLKTLSKIINYSVAGTALSASEAASALGANSTDINMLYLLYEQDNGDVSGWKLSPQEFAAFVCDTVLTNADYAEYIDADMKDNIEGLRGVIDAVVAGGKMSAAKISEIFTKLSSEMDEQTVSAIFLFNAGKNYADPDWEIPLLDLVNYLADDVTEDSRFASLMDDDAKQSARDMRDTLVENVDQVRGDEYSRLIIYTDYPYESEETASFIEGLHTSFEDNLSGSHYIIGNAEMIYEMENSFDDELNFITWLTAIAIFIVVLIFSRSLIVPLLLVLVVQCGVYCTVTVIGWQGYSIYYMAYLIVQCILMGATIDYGILYTNYYREKRRTMPIKEALIGAYNGSIHTIMTSGLIMILVTAIIAKFFENPTVGQICQTISMGAICATVIIVFILPGMLAALDRLVVGKRGFKEKE